MTTDGAELSSLATVVDELGQRVARLLGRYEGSDRDDVLGELYEAERALRNAGRRLTTARRHLGGPGS